jgi:hypothetical protein
MSNYIGTHIVLAVPQLPRRFTCAEPPITTLNLFEWASRVIPQDELINYDADIPNFGTLFHQQVNLWRKIPSIATFIVMDGTHERVISTDDFLSTDWICKDDQIYIFDEPCFLHRLTLLVKFSAVNTLEQTNDLNRIHTEMNLL